MQTIHAVLCLLAAQILVWFQLNGQFVWPTFRNNLNLIVIGLAIPISLLLASYQRQAYHIFDQSLWSMRLFGFSVGMIVFFSMTLIFKGEIINLKNLVCLMLAAGIVLIQVFAK